MPRYTFDIEVSAERFLTADELLITRGTIVTALKETKDAVMGLGATMKVTFNPRMSDQYLPNEHTQNQDTDQVKAD